MVDYRYSVSLRFWHPSRSPAEITAALQIEPSRSWAVGVARRTPKGTPLTGVYTENYWTARMIDGTSVDRDLAGAIELVLDKLDGRKSFLQEYASSGGHSELFIGWFFDDGNSGDELGHRLLARLAEFRIDLSFDVYPTAQN